MDELASKLAANRHRRQREATIRAAAENLGAVLESSECICGDSVSKWLAKLPWDSEPDESIDIMSGYESFPIKYFDCDNWNDVVAVLRNLDPPAGVSNLYLGDSGPLWNIDLNYYSEFIDQILELLESIGSSQFAWVMPDYAAGVMLTNHIGYLPLDRSTNDDEIVYEIRSWHVESAG